MKCPDGCTCGRHSAETREKMRKSHTGVAVSDDAREKIRAAKLGLRCPDGCTCGRHTPQPGKPRPKCPEGCTCGRHKARIPDGYERAALKHGLRYSPEYQSWAGMKSRCFNPNTEQYGYYGGRGITVCERWLAFENFYADMGPRPEPKSEYSIDRYPDMNGNYEPGNCRWATFPEQMANRRPASGSSASYCKTTL